MDRLVSFIGEKLKFDPITEFSLKAFPTEKPIVPLSIFCLK